MQRIWFLVWLLVTSLVACTGTTAVSPLPPSPTTARTYTATPFPSTLTPLPSPTETAVPATATDVPTPISPTNVPPTATTLATTTISVLADGIGFPDNVNPLTGETVSDTAVLARRPLAVKISNYPPYVRPQAGLNNADLVFEHLAEGNVTRFTAVFYSHDADPVGSIRSGRLIDLEIPLMYDAAFAYSGSAGPVRLMFKDSAFFSRIVSPDFAHGGFYRIADPDKLVEHTLFTNTYNLRYILDERGENKAPVFQNFMAFQDEPPPAGIPVTQLEIDYEGTYVTWWYDAGNGRYLRWTDGEPHLDANTGQQLRFTNIIVLAAQHQETDIQEDTAGSGHNSIQIQIWGEGPVSIFRDGQRFEGRWHRDDPQQMLTFTDLDGNVLPLAPGNSFFQLVPLGFDKLHVKP